MDKERFGGGPEQQFEQGENFALLGPKARVEAMGQGINPEVSAAIKRGEMPDVLTRATAEIFGRFPTLPKTEISRLSSSPLQGMVDKAARKLMEE